MRTLRDILMWSVLLTIVYGIWGVDDHVEKVYWFAYAFFAFLVFSIWKGLDDDEELAADARRRGVFHFYFKDQIKLMTLWWLIMGNGLATLIGLVVCVILYIHWYC